MQNILEQGRLGIVLIVENDKFSTFDYENYLKDLHNQLTSILRGNAWYRVVVFCNELEYDNRMKLEEHLTLIQKQNGLNFSYTKSNVKRSYEEIKEITANKLKNYSTIIFIKDNFKITNIGYLISYYLDNIEKYPELLVGIKNSVLIGNFHNLSQIQLFEQGWKFRKKIRFIDLEPEETYFDLPKTQTIIRRKKEVEEIKVSISILCLNRLEYTKECISSVINSKTNIAYELLITDNNSSDNTKEFIESIDHPNTVKIYHDNNLGFIGGHRYALEKAQGKYLLMLNNDVIVGNFWLDEIMKEFDTNSMIKLVGVHGGKLRDDGTGFRVNDNSYDYIEGDCIAVPTDFIKTFGLFSDNLKRCYYEDSDLSLRLREAGYKIKRSSAKVNHETSFKTVDTIPDGNKYKEANRIYFMERWGNYLKTRKFDVPKKSNCYFIKRRGAAGDVLYVLPIAKHYKITEPNCKICVSTSCQAILSKSKYIDSITTRKPQNSIYLDFELAHEKVPDLHPVDAYANVAGIDVKDKYPELPSNESILQQIKSKYSAPYIVTHWGPSAPGWGGRNLDKGKISAIVESLKQKGLNVVEVGHMVNANNSDAKEINRSWEYVIELVRNSIGFLGIDSSIMHIAQALKIKGVAIFGCVNPNTRLLPSSTIVPVYDDSLECIFCWNKAKPPKSAIKCKNGTNACMKNLTCEKIVETFIDSIGASSVFNNKNNIELKDLSIDWGCGFRKEEGYIGVDIQNYDCVDIICDINDTSEFPENCAEEIRSLHFIEHNSFEDINAILLSWKRILKPNGVLRIYFPDLSLVKRKTNESRACDHAFGQWNNEYDIHKSFWTQWLMCKFMQEAGFENVKPIPYTGELHSVDKNHPEKWTSGVEGYK